MKHASQRLVAIVLGLVACAAAGTAGARAYPTKPVRIVLPVTAAGGVDAVGRLIAHKLTALWNQQVIIDNRPGAGGNIASDIVAHANPDGHTLVIVTASHATNPSLYKKLTYDPIKDFVPVTKLSVQPYILVLSPTVAAKDVRELIALARNRQGGLSYASAGTGLLGHLSMELLRSMAKFEATHIPYKGASPALIDVLAGRVDAFFSTITSGLPQVKSGKLRAIGVTSTKRATQLPEVPTVAEQGYPGYEVISWYALLAPAGTPKPVIQTLNTEVVRILRTSEVKDRMASDGAEPDASTPEALGQYLAAEARRWARLIKEAGITME